MIWVKIEDSYINMSLITDMCNQEDGGCKVYFINKTTSVFGINVDELMGEVKKQLEAPLNKLIAEQTIEDRFQLMDMSEQ